MIPQQIKRMHQYLCSFLGNSKNPLDESYQCQFPCPRCVENKGERERAKYNLDVNLRLGVFQCWSCNQTSSDMHGSIFKLIRIYGSKDIAKAYKEALVELRESNLYRIQFDDGDFNYGAKGVSDIELPKNYKRITKGDGSVYRAVKYLADRGVGWDIISDYNLGVTTYDKDMWQVSNRIIIPSYDAYGDLNYWTGRDITGNGKRQKYYNPKAERMELIFNEDKVQWDADVTLVEGPFDHIVVPNSIPLLGKSLSPEYKIYREVMSKCEARVNIFLDGDAFDNVVKIYELLNTGRMRDRVRVIRPDQSLDPSEIYKLYGRDGISYFLGHTTKIQV